MEKSANKGLKQTLLSRYEQAADGSIFIDVAATRVENMYNDFDKNAPYVRRDLDEDLVDYLIDCAKELQHHSFVVRFTFDQFPDEGQRSRIMQSVKAYFLYLEEGEQGKIFQMFRRSAILFIVGLIILFIAISVNQGIGEHPSVVAKVFAEGLIVAAWVSLWESLAILFIEWLPHRRNTIIYKHLADAQISFRSDSLDKAK